MIDNIANFFLAFSQDSIIIPLLILGYIWFDRKIFFSAICLILLNMLFNAALKVTFQVPLDPSLGKKWFAFPSGHMQSAVVFYGWLMIQIRSPIFKVMAIILLSGIGYSLVHFGFHNYFDILGGIFFAVLLILIYRFILLKSSKIGTFSFATICMLYMFLIQTEHIQGVREYLWMPYYALIGFILASIFFAEANDVKRVKIKILSTIFCFIIIFIVRIIFSTEFFALLPVIIKQIQWFIIGFSIPFALFIAQKLVDRKNP